MKSEKNPDLKNRISQARKTGGLFQRCFREVRPQCVGGVELRGGAMRCRSRFFEKGLLET